MNAEVLQGWPEGAVIEITAPPAAQHTYTPYCAGLHSPGACPPSPRLITFIPQCSQTCFCDDHGKVYYCADGCPVCGKH